MNEDRYSEEGGARSSQITGQFSIPGAGGIFTEKLAVYVDFFRVLL